MRYPPPLMMAAGVTTATGKYRRITELGRGGMATVYLTAMHGPHGFQKLVVVKEMRGDLAEDPEFRRMFVEEARIAARLHHPNIVQTYEVVEEPPGVFSIVMEFLDGQSLSKLRSSARREVMLPLQLYVTAQALSGLEHVHQAGLVHRDVSPQNIFVTYDGDVKVLDFGIVKVTDSSVHTAVGTLKGKLGYMAPEQVLGKRIDRRTDVFAMGVVLWEALTGSRLWANQPEAAIVGRLASGSIPGVRSVKADIPEELDAICARAMRVDPDERFPTAAAFQEALEEFLDTVAARPSRRELAQLMTSLFAEKREKLQALIEGTLAGVIVPEPVSRRAPPSATTLPPTAVTATAAMPGAPRPPKGKGRSFLVGAVAIAGAITFGTGVGVLARRPKPAVTAELVSPLPIAASSSALSTSTASAETPEMTPASAARSGSSPAPIPLASTSVATSSPRQSQAPTHRTIAPSSPSAISSSQSRPTSVTKPPKPGDPDLGY